MATDTAVKFIEKWEKANLKESAASQSHFNDLCDLLGHDKPLDADPDGTSFTFEYSMRKTSGTKGFADVFKKGCFGWEYKGKKKDLTAAYMQLQQYAPALSNPPLLIVCDLDKFIIHTNWNDLVSVKHEIALVDLIDPDKLNILRWAFFEPDKLKPTKSRQQLTKEIAADFAKISQQLRLRGNDPKEVANFVNRLIFCMFAEDVELLPKNLFTQLLLKGITDPTYIQNKMSSLFKAMKDGAEWGADDILWFNGGLFNDDKALKLTADEISVIVDAAKKDWSDIDPSIMGTLFERGLDPAKQSQLGAHFTDRDMIMKIINPVIVEPFQSKWKKTKVQIEKELEKAEKYKKLPDTSQNARQITTAKNKAKNVYKVFLAKIRKFKVLDPACGSGNFLYLSLSALKDIEREVSLYGEVAFDFTQEMPEIGPENIYGIELSPYAAELAKVSVWVGEIQWIKKHGFTVPSKPVLRKLKNIIWHDALMNEDGSEFNWPKVDVVVGNPPFIGDKKMIRELGEDYTNSLRTLYQGRVPGGADLVCYWFAKSYDYMKEGWLERAGLVSTNSIRGGKNRVVLDQINSDFQIYNAWPDQPWVNEGASVRVSMTSFSKKQQSTLKIDNAVIEMISSDLTLKLDADAFDASEIKKLVENRNYSFQGTVKEGPFTISCEQANEFLQMPINPNGKSNYDVLKPWINGQDLTRRSSNTWIIDFGTMMSLSDAMLYEEPFKLVLENVKPLRDNVRRKNHREKWWLYGETRPGMRKALLGLDRFICTPRVSKYRLFKWVDKTVQPDCALVAIAKDDDTTFGILSSKYHVQWSLKLCTWLGKGNDPRYTPSTCFETFPFPDGLEPNIDASEYRDDPRAIKIAKAAKRLNDLRENWLNPSDLITIVPEVVAGYPDRKVPIDEVAEKVLKTRTLTNLYNKMPAWLIHAQADLDAAVAEAYEWPTDISDEDMLERLFKLNQARVTKK